MKFFIFVLALSSFAYAAAEVPLCGNEASKDSAPLRGHSNNINMSVDFLYWTIKEDGIGSDNWAQIATVESGNTTVLDVQTLSFNYAPGFRVGIGYDLPYDNWDTRLSYTWYRTHANDHISTSGEITSPFFGNFYASNYKYKKASIHFSLLLNMFDWELGRKCQVSNGLSIRPFLGLKGGWINQTIKTKWSNPTLSAKENIKNDFWGVGPSGGLNTQWRISGNECQFFSLIGDFSGALMWANWSIPDKYTNSKPQEVTIRFEEFYSASLMFQTFMGFGWQRNFYKDAFRFSLRAGYELQFWLEQFQVNDWNVGKLNNQLTLLGGTIDFRFDF